jgi:hypothetical protein
LREVTKLEKYLNNLSMVPATGLYRSKVIFALVSKALTVGRAVCALVDAGFPAEAFGLSRTVIEIYFLVRYIGNRDTEKRAARYAKFAARVQKEWLNVVRKHYPTTPLSQASLDKEILEIANEFQSKSHWTEQGGQAKLMAEEEDTVELDAQGKPYKSDFAYDALYFYTSHFVHVSVVALDAHATVPGDIFKVRTRPVVETKYAKLSLFNVATFLSKIFVCALRAVNEEQPPELIDLFKLTNKFDSKP